ncbi:hypothetical protein HMPREF1983_00939 [Gemella bergeri ATCC 700627]|uniref:Phage transcriptional regulator, RinA family n=1 Tax=Gemella bergeri ATCC 700627 TaxID=1321820 RepID=U2QMV1_9BACL|nr:hypothetical protein [Gemella bergeri]ERK57836.1 hypothetical protein HMPREF1983_00939 [Gemella bergeri ATCC 700627]
MYTREDAREYLKTYKILKLECEMFLLYEFQQGNKSEISTQKTGRENERNLIKKIDNKDYQRKKHILRCIESVFKSLNYEEERIIKQKFFDRLKNQQIANKNFMSRTKMKYIVNKILDELVKKLNEK